MTKTKTTTDNRIQAMIDSMTLEKVPVESLVPWDRNPRIHTSDVDVLVNSMTHFGWTNPVLAQKGTNRVIAGHGRIEAAKKKGLAIVPVIFLEFEDQDATAYTIADNASAERSEWDFSKLHELLGELKIDGYDTTFTALDEIRLDQFFPSEQDIAGKEYDETAADGVALLTEFRIKLPSENAERFERDLKQILKKHPEAEYEVKE